MSTDCDHDKPDGPTPPPATPAAMVPLAPNSAAGLSLALVGALVVMSTAVIAPALPDIGAYFHDDPRASYLVPLLVTAPALTIAIAAPVAGVVLDRFGRNRAVLLALVGFILFGIGGAVGRNLDWLLWTRAGLGVCVAFLSAGFTSLVGDLFSPDRRATMLGRQASLNAVIALSMTLAAGILAEWHWRAMFLIYLLAVPLVFMFARYVPRPALPARQPAEAGHPSAAEPPRRGAGLAVAAVYTLAILCMLCSMMLPTRVPFLMQETYGVSAAVIGIAMGFFTFGMLPSSMVFPRLRRVFSAPALFAAGFAIMAAGAVLVGFAPALPVLMLANGVCGFGFGLVMPNLSTSLLAVAPPRLRGRLAGGLTSALFLGQFLSPIASQPLVLRFGTQSSFLIAAGLLAAMTLLCAVAAARRNPPRRAGRRPD